MVFCLPLRGLRHCLQTLVLSLDGRSKSSSTLLYWCLLFFRAIQLSWLAFAFPCLLIAVSAFDIRTMTPSVKRSTNNSQYIGQAAYISQNKGAFSNPFFNSVPPGMFYPSLVVAILAAIVASQTMITATFQVGSLIEIVCTLSGMLKRCIAPFANHQAVILSSDQGEAHIEDFPWPDLYPVGELAAHGWHYMRDRSL